MLDNNLQFTIHNSPLNNWVETTLGEVCEIIMGQSPKGETYNLDGNGLPFYQGVTEFDEKYVKIKTYTSEPTKIIEPNTILFSVRAPVGRVNFTKHKSCIGRGNAGLKMNNENQEFLFHLLKFLERQIQNRTSGTVFTSISGKELKEIPIIVPTNPTEQQAIASVLSAFDDKIELLREQNKTLEEMGQVLFNYEFRMVNGEKNGELLMVNDELEKENSQFITHNSQLKKGWRIGKLGEENFAEIIGSGINKFDDEKIYLATADVSNSNITNTNEKITFQERPSRANMQPIEKSIWFAKMQDSRKLLMFDDYSKFEIENFILSTGFAGIKTTEFSHYFMWCFILSKEFNELKNNMANGAVQIAVNNTNLEKIEILIPDDETLAKFNELAKPIFKKIYNNNSQIQSLARSRDELLPRLMSGEVRVK